MPMTQEDIRRHYEVDWRQKSESATDSDDLAYCSPIDDAVVLPAFKGLIEDSSVRVNGGRVLDVGCGSGRWVRCFLKHYQPRRLVGIDFARSSIDLLNRWMPPSAEDQVEFRQMDVTQELFELDEEFDLINIQNVMYHIPEPDRYQRALCNMVSVLADDGCIIVNEYMPRSPMRTEWMLTRSRDQVAQAVAAAGLRIDSIRPCKFFDSASMGVEGPDEGVRGRLQSVWSRMDALMKSNLDPRAREFFLDLFVQLDQAVTAFCVEKMAPIELPAGKLLLLRRVA